MREFFGSLMRQYRAELGITLRELASKVGCMPSLLSEVENGLRAAPKDKDLLTRIAHILGLDPERVYESAKNDQERRDLKALKAMFAKDDELAACYCRAKEQCNQEEIRKILMEAFRKVFIDIDKEEEK